MSGRRLSRVLSPVALIVAAVALSCAQSAGATVAAVNINVTVSPAPVAAGQSFTVKARAVDASSGKTVTTFNGAATLSDSTTTLSPTTASFTKGVMTAPATISDAAKDDVITVSSSGANPGNSAPFKVIGPATTIVLKAPGTVSAPNAFSLLATVEDTAGNTVPYTGAGHWSDDSGSLHPSAPAAFSKGVSKNPKTSITQAVNPDTITVNADGVSGSTQVDMPVITPASTRAEPAAASTSPATAGPATRRSGWARWTAPAPAP
jgi:hypothetical protein